MSAPFEIESVINDGGPLDGRRMVVTVHLMPGGRRNVVAKVQIEDRMVPVDIARTTERSGR